ncbi:nickel/cobalt transporter [Caballeronia sp. BR00000012568055]|uniref:nickel/cobalt transporter n=1 Tax=Caballeronia sp. BR00000012568055 TaxID=2918761 RepID=UPI0023F97FB5|nr:high frequency lysogenization protein HflD [Caballeronia sp. BR00000012568055]
MLKRLIGKLLLIAMLLVTQAASAQNLDMFGRPASGTVVVEPSQPKSHVPEWARDAVGTSIRWQSELNARLQDAFPDRNGKWGSLAALTVILLSFAYGVLHALGPGHGKTIVGTYLVSHPTRIGEAMLLGVWSATAQALSAIALVGGAAWLARHGLDGVLTQAARLELVSYVALLLVGLWTAWSIATKRDCCKPARVQFASFSKTSTTNENDAAYLGSKLAMHRRGARQSILLTGLAVGIRPCAGSIFVLVAGLDQGAFGVGIISTFAMSAGVALTICAIGLASRGINRTFAAKSARFDSLRRRVALGGAGVIVAFAAWQVFALVAGWSVMGLA